MREIDELADDVVIVEQPEFFYAVGQVYEYFHHLQDEEVIELLEDFEHRRQGNYDRITIPLVHLEADLKKTKLWKTEEENTSIPLILDP